MLLVAAGNRERKRRKQLIMVLYHSSSFFNRFDERAVIGLECQYNFKLLTWYHFTGPINGMILLPRSKWILQLLKNFYGMFWYHIGQESHYESHEFAL